MPLYIIPEGVENKELTDTLDRFGAPLIRTSELRDLILDCYREMCEEEDNRIVTRSDCKQKEFQMSICAIPEGVDNKDPNSESHSSRKE